MGGDLSNEPMSVGDEGTIMPDEPYDLKQLEDDLIRYICEKIVAMRE